MIVRKRWRGRFIAGPVPHLEFVGALIHRDLVRPSGPSEECGTAGTQVQAMVPDMVFQSRAEVSDLRSRRHACRGRPAPWTHEMKLLVGGYPCPKLPEPLSVTNSMKRPSGCEIGQANRLSGGPKSKQTRALPQERGGAARGGSPPVAVALLEMESFRTPEECREGIAFVD
jgi:hypothetical protein